MQTAGYFAVIIGAVQHNLSLKAPKPISARLRLYEPMLGWMTSRMKIRRLPNYPRCQVGAPQK
jgi:hypothetical protein